MKGIKMTYINRFIESVILDNSVNFPVIMITGARQVGKTTILKHIMDENGNISFVTLDDMNERSMSLKEAKLFL